MALRDLAASERALLEFMLSADFAGRDDLLRQAATVRTAGLSCSCGCPSFWLNPDRSLPRARVDEVVPVEAHGRDKGGNSVGVLLFVVDGYLRDLEIFGYDNSDFAGVPRPADLSISEWSEPDENGVRRLLNE